MSRPKVVRIAPYNWDVAWSRNTVLHFHPEEDACGACDAASLTIAIDPGDAEDYNRATLLHEILHACLRSSDPAVDDEQEEMVVAAITGPLLSALKDNPELIEYLTE
jgi:hypothetical protein